MTSDEKLTAAVVCGWGLVCLLLVASVFMGIKFVCTKTYNAYTSWKDRPVVVKVDIPKKVTPKIVTPKKAKPRIVTPKKSVDKKAARLAKLRKSYDWDDEFGNAYWNADGTLKDYTPDDPYTPEQGYCLLGWIVLLFFLWVGFARGTILGVIVTVIGLIILLISGLVMWQW